jgi:hypothetical protein
MKQSEESAAEQASTTNRCVNPPSAPAVTVMALVSAQGSAGAIHVVREHSSTPRSGRRRPVGEQESGDLNRDKTPDTNII